MTVDMTANAPSTVQRGGASPHAPTASPPGSVSWPRAEGARMPGSVSRSEAGQSGGLFAFAAVLSPLRWGGGLRPDAPWLGHRSPQ